MTTGLVLAVARRAIMVAFAALIVAIVALAVAFWALSDTDVPEGDLAEKAAPGQSQADAAIAQAEVEEATSTAGAAAAMAEDAAAMAEDAAARAAAAEEALAAARAEAGGAVDPEVVARLEAQLEELRADASAARAEADAAAAVEEAAAGEAGVGEAAVEEAAAVDATPEDATVDEDVPETSDTDATVPLPGEPYEFGPSAGAGLAVVGVTHDSALNVRDVPNGEIVARLDNVMDGVRDPVLVVRGANTDEIVATLDLQQGIVATGNTRKLPTTIWHEVRLGDVVGWASGAYLAPLGASRDATAEVMEALGGLPMADTLQDLGLQVSDVFASSGEVQSKTTVSSRPGVFEALGDITLDVLGLPDDAVRGYRISIAADAGAEDWMQDDAGPFTLRSVSVTTICDTYRGVSAGGLCN